MNRVFRNYFEKTYITPTEVIHNFRELKRIQDKDTLVASAVDRVAFLQTREGEQDSKARRDEIFKSVERNVGPRPQGRGPGVAQAERVASARCAAPSIDADNEEERDYLALVVLSRDLLDARNWMAKLEKLCALALKEADPHGIDLLDGVIADVLGANIVQEVLGWQPSLGHAIRSMLDLADGHMPAGQSDTCESTEALNRLFGEGKLKASRACLVDRAHRQLRSTNPLYRSDSSKEHEEFQRVLLRMLGPTGLYSGAESAEALTTRFTRMVEQGGAAGRRAAITGVFRAMPDRASGVLYLCDLARSEYAVEHGADMVEPVRRRPRRPRHRRIVRADAVAQGPHVARHQCPSGDDGLALS